MIYAIADLHLPSSLGKTMDRFGSIWRNHPDKVRRNWVDVVRKEDSVVVCGDISWAMRLEEARTDLEFISTLPGTKYLIRGNHDYWWGRSATRRIQETLPADMILLQGEGRVVEGIGLAGTRGWQADGREPTPQDARIINRELSYLRQALESLPEGPRVALLHYPPYNADLRFNEFGRLLLELNVELAVFGHLHVGNPNVLDGQVGGLELQLVSVDQVQFSPQPLRVPGLRAGSRRENGQSGSRLAPGTPLTPGTPLAPGDRAEGYQPAGTGTTRTSSSGTPEPGIKQ